MDNLFDLRDKLTFDESLRYLSDAGFTLNAQELFHFVLEKKIQLNIFSYTRDTLFTISSINLVIRKQPYWCFPEDGALGFIIYVDTEGLRLTKYIVNRDEYRDRPISQCMWDATDYYAGFLTEDIRSLLEQALKISEKPQSITNKPKLNKIRDKAEWCEIAYFTQNKYYSEGKIISKGDLAKKIGVFANRHHTTINGWFNAFSKEGRENIKSIPALTSSIKNNHNGIKIFDLFDPKTGKKID